ncbi:MAG: PKD domain-containing protein [Methanoregula sp.]|jgi:PKD repeat protein
MKDMKKAILLLAVVFTLFMVIPAVSAITEERIVNGDFDDPINPSNRWWYDGDKYGNGAQYDVSRIASGGHPQGPYAQLYVDSGIGSSGWANVKLYQTEVNLDDVPSITFWYKLDETGSQVSGMSEGNIYVEGSYGRPLEVDIDNQNVKTLSVSSNSWTQASIPLSGYQGKHKITFYTEISGAKYHKIGIDSVSAIANIPPPHITSISPTTAENSGIIGMTITGTGFRPGDNVKLNRTGQADIMRTDLVNPSSTQIGCTFDLTGKQPGVWNVVVMDDYEQEDVLWNAFTITTQPVVANFTADPTYGTAPLTVQFTDTSTGSPTGWIWDFGDGTSATVRNPGHTYLANRAYTVSLTATNGGGNDTMTRGNFICVGDCGDTIGLYDKSNGTFYLTNNNSAGAADITFPYGWVDSNDLVPLAGDWDGDGDNTVGLYSKSSGTFYLRNIHEGGAANITFAYGWVDGNDLVPLTGDWNNDGIDTVGLYSKSSGTFYLRNIHEGGAANITFPFGSPSTTGDLVPLTGLWV